MQGGVAGAAVDLDAFAAHPLGHLRGEQLGHRGLLVATLAGVDLLADEVVELASGLDLGRHFGDLEADRLELGDRAAELLAVVGVGNRIVERALGQADGACGGVGAGRLEARGRVVEGLALLADHVRRRDTEIVEGQLPGLPAEVADLGNRRAAAAFGQLAALLLDEEHRQPEVTLARGRVRGARNDDQEVSAVGEGAPVLVAADQVARAVLPGSAGDVGDVRAGVGLGHGEGPQEFALGHARQVPPALLLAHHVRADQEIAAGDQGGDAHPTARQLLGHQAVLEAAQAKPAVLLRNENAEVAELRHLVAQVHRDVALLRIELVGDGQHLVEGEFARLLLDHAALFGDVRHGSGVPEADEIGALEVDRELLALIEALGVPGDDAESLVGVGQAAVEHDRFGAQGITGIDGPMEAELVDAQEGAAALAQVLDGEAEHSSEDQQRIGDDAGMAVGAGVGGVEIVWIEMQRQRREEGALRFGDRAAPVVPEDPSRLEVLIAIALGDEARPRFQVFRHQFPLRGRGPGGPRPAERYFFADARASSPMSVMVSMCSMASARRLAPAAPSSGATRLSNFVSNAWRCLPRSDHGTPESCDASSVVPSSSWIAISASECSQSGLKSIDILSRSALMRGSWVTASL